jgi:hypothetical protein
VRFLVDLLDAVRRAGGRAHVNHLVRVLNWRGGEAQVRAVAYHYGLTVEDGFVSTPACQTGTTLPAVRPDQFEDLPEAKGAPK